MKKKIIAVAVFLSIAIIASIGINFNISNEEPTLSMKNIEAMARGEVDINPNTMYNHTLIRHYNDDGVSIKKICCEAEAAANCNPTLQLNCN